MKINRLTEIMLILLNKKSVTAKELSQKFNVSTRTIYRDIDTLSLSGVPVYMTKGKGGGISLLDEFSINKTILSQNDKENLITALNALSSIQYPEINTLINKIGFMKNDESENWIDIDFSSWGNKLKKDEKFEKIKNSILENKLIELDYINSFSNKSQRIIEPMKLIYKGQSWYLFGYCRLKEDFRIFKISRIKDIEIKEDYFIKKKINNLNEYEDKLIEHTVKLKLKINKEALHRVFDDFDEESVIDNKDGTYEITTEFPENEWLYGYLLSFGPYLEILEPIYIRNIILERMKEAIKIYDR